jgi:neurotransmitter:Na+ symporter, NSS family
MKAQLWSSRTVFILAAIGAAAGLGNLWRFPYLAYENGGGAFVIAYLLCLVFFTKPLMMMEIAFGQASKTEVVEAMGRTRAGRFGKFTAWFVIGLLFVLAGYYAAIIGWGFDFLAASPTVAWGGDAQTYFHGEVLHLTESPSIVGGLSWKLVLGVLAGYVAVYFSIFKGAVSVGKVVKWTVPIPFLLLLVLFINSATLEGAMEGYKYFLVPDWASFAKPTLWRDALLMSFFSTNVGLVLTMLYASYNKSKTEIVQSAWLIGFGDLAVSLVAGLAMFGTLGYMSASTGISIEEVVQSGPTLAFVTIPTALATLPIAPAFFATIFFIAILTLGIDSMFAIVEVVNSTFRNQFKWFKKFSLEKVTLIFCVILFFWSLCFATGNGLYRLDVADHFLFAHLLYIGVIFQLIVIGWFYGADKIRKTINETSGANVGKWLEYLIKWVAPIVFGGLYLMTLPSELAAPYGGYDMSFVIKWGLIPVGLVVLVAFILSFKKGNSA